MTKKVNSNLVEAGDLKKSQDFLFQFICHETGARSEPFVSDWRQMKEILLDREPGQKPADKDYILLVAVLDDKQTHIPKTPLIHVETFMDIQPNAKKAEAK